MPWAAGCNQRVYNYIKKHLDQSLQAYIVCPLVEEGESELAAAQEYAEKLQKGPFLAIASACCMGV